MATIRATHKAVHSLGFDGAILKRGFWIYVYRVTSAARTYLYVGRTGDSSSIFAASPFARLGRHLDLRDNAKANTLVKRLREQRIEPDRCHFELIAFGPMFPEQKSKVKHKAYLDKTASLETGLADELKRRGYRVLGSHDTPGKPDMRTLKRLVTEVEKALKINNGKGGHSCPA